MNLAAATSIMTPYEWARVLINLGQLIAMIVIPFIVLKYRIKFTVSNEERHDSKN